MAVLRAGLKQISRYNKGRLAGMRVAFRHRRSPTGSSQLQISFPGKGGPAACSWSMHVMLHALVANLSRSILLQVIYPALSIFR
jgi:anti-sigma factor RsiW